MLFFVCFGQVYNRITSIILFKFFTIVNFVINKNIINDKCMHFQKTTGTKHI